MATAGHIHRGPPSYIGLIPREEQRSSPGFGA